MIASYVGENQEFARQYLSGELEVCLHHFTQSVGVNSYTDITPWGVFCTPAPQESNSTTIQNGHSPPSTIRIPAPNLCSSGVNVGVPYTSWLAFVNVAHSLFKSLY